MALKLILMLSIALVSNVGVFAKDFSIGSSEEVYMLSLTPESYFESFVSETIEGDINIDWSKATACYSASIAQEGLFQALSSKIDWFDKVQKKPIYNDALIEKHDNNILYSVKTSSITALQVRGSIHDSVFTLRGEKKQCDIVLVTANELSQLFYSDLSVFTDSGYSFGLAKKFKQSISKELLNGFKQYINAFSSSNIAYGNFNEILEDAEIIWKTRDIFEHDSGNSEIGPIYFERLLSSKQFNEAKQLASKKTKQVMAEFQEKYENDSGLFVKIRHDFDRSNFELCSLATVQNSEAPSLILSIAIEIVPSRTFHTEEINEMFSYILRNSKGCNMILSSNEQLKKLDKAFTRKNIIYDLLPAFITFENLSKLDGALSNEKETKKIWQQELERNQQKLICNEIMPSLRQQCVDLGENCVRWQIIKNNCS